MSEEYKPNVGDERAVLLDKVYSIEFRWQSSRTAVPLIPCIRIDNDRGWETYLRKIETRSVPAVGELLVIRCIDAHDYFRALWEVVE